MQKKYSDVAHLPTSSLIEEEACQWIVKFEGDNEPSAKDIQQFNDWMKRSPVHKKTLLKMTKSWGEMDLLSSLAIPLEQSIQPKHTTFEMWTLAPLLVFASMIRYLGRGLAVFSRPLIALPALVLAITIGLTYWQLNSKTIVPSNSFVTNVGHHSTHTLEDGSVLWLNSNTQVKVNYTNDKRMVYLLKGEAHFKVQSDVNRPFEVYVGKQIVKAVGTAFSVYRTNKKINVMVSEGKVDLAIVESAQFSSSNSNQTEAALVSSADLKNSPNVITVLTSLKAGQSVAMPLESITLSTPVIEHEPGELARKLSWLEGRLVFAGESLEEVVEEVSRHTSILIEVNDPDLQKLRIGGQFQAGETDALFDVLESGFGIKITRINDDHVQLNAKKY